MTPPSPPILGGLWRCLSWNGQCFKLESDRDGAIFGFLSVGGRFFICGRCTPPSPPVLGNGFLDSFLRKGLWINRHIFSYLLIFYPIFLEGVCLICALVMLRWKVHRAIIRGKLEPYLGFLHSMKYGKPSLVCDLQELYRYLVDDFMIQFCQGLKERNFTVKSESVSRKRRGKREYLNDEETKNDEGARRVLGF